MPSKNPKVQKISRKVLILILLMLLSTIVGLYMYLPTTNLYGGCQEVQKYPFCIYPCYAATALVPKGAKSGWCLEVGSVF